MHRRCRGSHISRAPFAPLGSGAHSAPAWVGWLPANFIAGSALLVFCSRVRAAAKHSVLTSTFYRKKNKFLKSGFVRSPAYNKLKTHLLRREAKLLTHNAWEPAKGKFWCGQNLPFCSKKTQKIKRCQGTDFSLKKTFLVLQYIKLICSICILFL